MTAPDPRDGCTLWPLIGECLPDCWDPDPARWTMLQRWSVQAASGILRRLTAGMFNLCPIKVRPCRQGCAPDRYRYLGDPSGLPWIPAMLDGKIYNLECGICRNECGCGPLQELILDPFARAIIEVKVDGKVLPPTAYRVDDYRRLVRLDGGRWPDCQELDRPDTAPETWSVSYWTGTEPDAGASFALTDLSVEWWKACQGKPCAFGEHVKQVSRQGVTIDMDTVYESIREGRTGLKRVDMWIFSVNPHGLRRRLRVYSPDIRTPRRTTWPAHGVGPGPTPGGDLGVVFLQPDPAEVWTIPHTLDFVPAGVRCTDLSGMEIRGEVTYPAENVVRIAFNQPVAGSARLS